MFFPESEAIARDHSGLLGVIKQVDQQLCRISSAAPLRPADFSGLLGAEENQVVSVFELLAKNGLLYAEEMVECGRCQNLMPAAVFRQACDDEDDFECTSCGRVFPAASEPVGIYRMTAPVLNRIKAEAQKHYAGSTALETDSTDEPLSPRAQLVLIAMIELGAVDSDTRKSTEEIARRAVGNPAHANSLKTVMSELSTRRLIETMVGRGGGCWLTQKGHARATKLRNQ